jgi:ABC-2 type transport system permease protein
LAQVTALIWLRYRLLLAKASGGSLRAVAQIVSFLLILIFSLAVYFVLVMLFRGLPREPAFEALHGALAVVWIAWIVLPIVGVAFDDSTDLSKLLLYPMTARRMTVAVLVSNLVSSIAGLTVLLALPVGWARHFVDAPIIALAVVLFAAHMSAVVECVRIVVWDVLRSRRVRDWLILLSSVFGILIYVGQMMVFRGGHFGNPAAWLRFHPSHYTRFLPSSLLAGVTTTASAGHYLASGAYLLACAGLAAATVALMSVLVRRVQAGEAETGGAVRRAPARARQATRRGIALPISTPVATVARKELLLFRRDPRLKIQVMQAVFFPLAWVVVNLFSFPTGAGSSGLYVFPSLVAWMLFGSFMLSSNVFGFEREAVTVFFLFPASRSALIAGKNLAMWLTLMIAYSPALVVLGALSRQWTLVPLAVVYAAGALAVSIGIGNFLSIYAPYRLPSKRQNPFSSQRGPGCIGMLLNVAGVIVSQIISVPLAAAVVLPLVFHAPVWYGLAIPAGLIYAWGIYRAMLSLAAERMAAREPEIIEALGASGGE